MTDQVAAPARKQRPSSRIPDFFKLSVAERTRTLKSLGHLTDDDVELLSHAGLHLGRADGMIENVIGVFGLPLGLGLNFLINGTDYVVPLAVEEPSIVAGLSARRAHCTPVRRIYGQSLGSLADRPGGRLDKWAISNAPRPI